MADSELQPSSVRGGEDFTADFTFVHDHFFNNFQLNLYLFRVRLGLRHFLGRRLRLGQARVPSAAARGRAPRQGQTIGGKALRPHDQLYPCVTYEIHVQN